MSNYINPKCGVCCDSREVPVWKPAGHSVAFTLDYMVRCPYCDPQFRDRREDESYDEWYDDAVGKPRERLRRV
jgi:glycyl-tRNA synthetase (class II)